MFTGTADGRVVKLENGEVETIARFGSGPCSKLVTHHSEGCPFLLDVTFIIGKLLTICQTGHTGVTSIFFYCQVVLCPQSAQWSPWQSLWCPSFPVGLWSRTCCVFPDAVSPPLPIQSLVALWELQLFIAVGVGAAFYKDRGFVTVRGLHVIP